MTEVQKAIPGSSLPFPGQLLVMSHQMTQPVDVITLVTIPMLSRQPGEQLSPVEGDVPRRHQFCHLGRFLKTGRSPAQASSGLMRDIGSSRRPIDDGPVAISQMRPPSTLLGNRRHFHHPPGADLGLSPDNELIQPILGVTPQLHDPNVQPGCDKKSSVVNPGQECLATGHHAKEGAN